MPTNLYGKGDNYHPTTSHVMASLIRKFCDAVNLIQAALNVGDQVNLIESLCMLMILEMQLFFH